MHCAVIQFRNKAANHTTSTLQQAYIARPLPLEDIWKNMCHNHKSSEEVQIFTARSIQTFFFFCYLISREHDL